MRCCDVEELWDELRESNCDPNLAVNIHLSGCPDCRETFRQNDRLVSCLAGMNAVEPPADLRSRVLFHVRVSCTSITQIDSLTKVESPIGALYVAYCNNRISFTAVDQGEGFEAIGKRMEQRLRRGATRTESPAWIQDAIARYFQTFVIDLDLLDISGLSEFDRAALIQAAQIPPGQVRSYGWIAQQLGKPQAARAVGRAMARNPLAPFFPCHRVVDCNGALHQYYYGLEMKARILSMEGYICEFQPK